MCILICSSCFSTIKNIVNVNKYEATLHANNFQQNMNKYKFVYTI